MTDKELIELAAKAYGFGDPEGNFVWTESEYPLGSKTSGALWNYMGWCDTAELWNPLTDDGDALRLAVKIGMLIDVRYTQQEAIRYNRVAYWPDPSFGEIMEFGDVEADPMAATRSAITRAAAQIGKEME